MQNIYRISSQFSYCQNELWSSTEHTTNMGMETVIYSCRGYDEKGAIQNYVEIIKKKSADLREGGLNFCPTLFVFQPYELY